MDTARGQAEQAGAWLGELQPTARDGRRVVVQIRWTLGRDVDGHPISILTIDTDLTERRQLEQQFYRSQRLESLGALAGGIAHDLNNVLAPTMLATGVLHERMAGDDSRELLTMIGESARRLYQAHAAQIAVVVTDMMVPGLGGDGLIREQQRLNRTRVLRQMLAAVLAEPVA